MIFFIYEVCSHLDSISLMIDDDLVRILEVLIFKRTIIGRYHTDFPSSSSTVKFLLQ